MEAWRGRKGRRKEETEGGKKVRERRTCTKTQKLETSRHHKRTEICTNWQVWN